MARCEGKTKSGTRCKRSVAESVRYCSAHADQAPAAEGPKEAPKDEQPVDCLDRDPVDALLAVALGGVVIGAALVFRRVFRIL